LTNFFYAIQDIIDGTFVEDLTVESNLRALPSPDEGQQIGNSTIALHEPTAYGQFKPDLFACVIGCDIQVAEFR